MVAFVVTAVVALMLGLILGESASRMTMSRLFLGRPIRSLASLGGGEEWILLCKLNQGDEKIALVERARSKGGAYPDVLFINVNTPEELPGVGGRFMVNLEGKAKKIS